MWPVYIKPVTTSDLICLTFIDVLFSFRVYYENQNMHKITKITKFYGNADFSLHKNVWCYIFFSYLGLSVIFFFRLYIFFSDLSFFFKLFALFFSLLKFFLRPSFNVTSFLQFVIYNKTLAISKQNIFFKIHIILRSSYYLCKDCRFWACLVFLLWWK